MRARAIVRELRRRGSASVADLATELGYVDRAHATSHLGPIQDTIGRLKSAGVVEEINGERSKDRIRLRSDIGILAGVEIAGSVARAAVSWWNFSQPVVGQIALPAGNAQKSLCLIAELVHGLLQKPPYGERVAERFVGVGLALPGPILREPNDHSSGKHAAEWNRHPETGTILPGWHRGVNVGGTLATELKTTHGLGPPRHEERRIVWLENDASAGALGVLSRLRAISETPPEDVFYVRMTVGIGAGIINKGHLITGAHGFAGELGHVIADRAGSLCHVCGRRGCLETLASNWAVVAQLLPVLRGAGYKLERNGEPIDPGAARNLRQLLRAERLDLPENERRPHPAVDRALADSGSHVGTLLAQLCTFLDPEQIVLGGTQAEYCSQHQDGQRPFAKAVERAIRAHALPQVAADDRLQVSTWSDLAKCAPEEQLTPELLGALALVIDHLGDGYLLAPIVRHIDDRGPGPVDFRVGH